MEDSVTPSTALTYLNPSYWFSKEEQYEWFKDYSYFRHLIQPHLTPHSVVLELGCGNSQMCEQLHKDGTTNITCIDLSPVAVQNMQKRLHSRGFKEAKIIYYQTTDIDIGMKYPPALSMISLLSGNLNDLFSGVSPPNHIVSIHNALTSPTYGRKVDFNLYIKVLQADMLELPFEDECFDLVIEKGTMDVLFVDTGNPWNPKPETISKVMATLKGVHRVLKAGGTFISVTFGQPHFRHPIFNAPDFSWSVEWTTFGETFHYFVYVLKKGLRSSHDDIPPFKRFEAPPINLLHEELESEDFAFRINVDELNY